MRQVRIRNLPAQATEAAVRAACAVYGEVTEVRVSAERGGARGRGHAVVTFEAEEDARHARDNLDRAELFGSVIRADICDPARNIGIGIRPASPS